VKAVLLYARANNLGPGYIYSHLAKDATVDELYLRFAMLDEAILELFQQAVAELKLSGGGFLPDVTLSIPPEQVDLFAQFVEIFAGVESATVAAAIYYSQSVLDSSGPNPLGQPTNSPTRDLAGNLAPISLASPDAANQAYQQNQVRVEEDNKLPNPLPQSSPQEVGERIGTKPLDLEALWRQILSQLQLQMPRATFQTLLKDTRLVTREGSKFVVAVSSGFAKDWLENRLLTTIQRTVRNLIKTNDDQKLPEVEIKFVVDGNYRGA
jgi:hypothetical protein